jgi:CheY-like chemotaxis protein
MGGDLTVTSTLGAGTTFMFAFPAKKTELAQARPMVLARATHHVLVVDDAEANRTLLAKLLGSCGCTTRLAGDGPTALSIAADSDPDVILVDLRMPGMNGIETIRRLRSAGSRAVIAALTAGAFGNDEREALDAGADFFLQKPFDTGDLLDRLERHVAPSSDSSRHAAAT